MTSSLAIIATATGVVALAEIGDKTMLLALLLSARFRQPGAVIAGILVATLANHALAAWAGAALAGWLDGPWFQLAVALGFIAMAAWTLVPDKMDELPSVASSAQAFAATSVAFFMAEIGDKTQIATIGLGARYHDVLAVTIGTTLGMLMANVPAVLLGDKLLARVPLKAVRIGAAVLLAAVGVAALVAVWPQLFR
ncbi:TMEM165/GDT1 family protein [Sandarakinorhabdus sp. AAP62]|uniref:TMEM165/GDT1 family protein n=1 Tax=Sandarakinorhabdus sp. AAP62 TaxID=1248916 RepID=UPI0002D8E151|nr:TMEM165/GDT1 family protein [Sandarakinorhabdus sp. AAP62]